MSLFLQKAAPYPKNVRKSINGKAVREEPIQSVNNCFGKRPKNNHKFNSIFMRYFDNST